MLSASGTSRTPNAVALPTRTVGSLVAFCLDTARAAFRPPFAWREFLQQAWFIASVSIMPATLMTLSFAVFTLFTLNILFIELGAGDLAGAANSLAVVQQIGPILTVLVVIGAGATAMCADLGARTIRDEISAMEVLGIDPLQRLVVPRVAASVVVGVFLSGLVSIVGTVGGFFFSVFVQGISPGGYAASFTLITETSDLWFNLLRAALFGLEGALIACFLGLKVGGGPKAVGEAVNQTVVYGFIILLITNTLSTAVEVQLT